MFTLTLRNQTFDQERGRFERSLAEYRARVYEAAQLARSKQKVRMKTVIQNRLVKPTILVIEDNTDDWFLTRYSLLRQFPKAECAWLANAAEVILYVDQSSQTENDLPSLILLDLYLPSAKKGLSVLQTLKSHLLYQSIPIVVFSHSVDPADITAVFTHSANAYINKPIEPREWQTVFAQLEPYGTESPFEHASNSSRNQP